MKEHELIGNFDARVWAKEWLEIIKRNPDIPTDEGAMHSWFANAIMTGYDKGKFEESTRCKEEYNYDD